MKALCFIGTLSFFASLAGPAGARTDEVALGHDRAIESCSSCHQVTPEQKPPKPVSNSDEMELVSAPNFAQIAIKYEGHDGELRAFIRAPRHPMKEQQFLDSDLNAIVAYIHSLSNSKSAW